MTICVVVLRSQTVSAYFNDLNQITFRLLEQHTYTFIIDNPSLVFDNQWMQ
jgi:hypothetical protein